MRISHRHKFVFLSNPRCGSTSLRSVLDPWSDIVSGMEYPYRHVTNARALRRHFQKMGWDWETYTVFTTIRNPWDRVVSLFHFGLQTPTSIWSVLARQVDNDFERFVCGLADFLVWVYETYHKPTGQTNIAIDQFAFDGPKCLVNHIIPIENVDGRLGDILLPLNIKVDAVPHLNRSVHRDYRYYHNETTKRAVVKLMSSDIEIGKYRY